MSKFMWAGVGMLPLAALAMMGGTALAADLPVQSPPLAPMAGSAPIISWTGFYIGAQAGYGWGGGAAAFGNAAGAFDVRRRRARPERRTDHRRETVTGEGRPRAR